VTGPESEEKVERKRRRREIAQLVSEQGRVTVYEITERFGVSSVTARSDLEALASSGDLVRSHGGAVGPRRSPLSGEGDSGRLAQAALNVVGPDEPIMIGSGPAALALAMLVCMDAAHARTVITYSLRVAACLSEAPHVSLIMLGGIYRSGNFLGPSAEGMMKSLHAGHCFLNASGVSAETGVTTLDIMEANLNQEMIAAASQVTLIAEAGSLGRRCLAVIADFRKIRRVICESSAPASELNSLRELGVELVLV
jgi:DeoR family transcriptional regulator of aga operon